MILVLLFISQINASGYVETRPYLTWNDSTYFTGYNRGWLELKTADSDHGLQVALDLIVPYDTSTLNYAADNTSISRLALWLGDERTRIIVGKQSLYWGVGRVFRPLDTFNRTNYFEPGYERAGYNALLGYFSLGDLTDIRILAMPDGDINRTLIGTRVGTNFAGNDIGMTIMHRASEHQTIIGGEIAGELAVGYWGEMSYTRNDTIDYTKISVGLDYTFPLTIYAMIEYYFDGSGVDDPAYYDYMMIIEGQRQTLAQHYLYASIGLFNNPFIRPSINSITNLDDRGTIIIPQLSYAIMENAEVTVGLSYTLGSTESEFRNITPYRGAVYVWGKVYF
ncbi:hypothetical protein AMJ83_00325 [candidate division WOR_3 bacterium SM23_42]|uniref:Alginate export domain-containing protein n=1 Tax=candidate division WOR_3 bacterium SM23_42 TaxID=1703779 RepID=A0A0S8FY80_UNCW3|nr:MAG: hypothetical protein AMJ83_00325 [candidate division WOR_3 bacterium SM23_42]